MKWIGIAVGLWLTMGLIGYIVKHNQTPEERAQIAAENAKREKEQKAAEAKRAAERKANEEENKKRQAALYASYLPHLSRSSDWAEVRWDHQVEITQHLGRLNDVSDAYKIDACLDMSAKDVRFRNRSFKKNLNDCVDIAKKDKS